MTSAIINQRELQAQLKDDLEMAVATDRIHQWIKDGMPLAPKGGKKPRFVYAHVRAWLLGQSEAVTPLSQQVRDHLFRASLGKGA